MLYTLLFVRTYDFLAEAELRPGGRSYFFSGMTTTTKLTIILALLY